MKDIVRDVNHAKLMLQTAAYLLDGPDPNGYRDNYLQWAEQALVRAVNHVKKMR